MSWTFNLRDNAKWSDGQPFTADDVDFTFNEIVLKNEAGRQRARQLLRRHRTSKVVDPETVKFNLIAPFSRAALVPGL